MRGGGRHSRSQSLDVVWAVLYRCSSIEYSVIGRDVRLANEILYTVGTSAVRVMLLHLYLLVFCRSPSLCICPMVDREETVYSLVAST